MQTLAKIGWIHLSYALILVLIGFIIGGYLSRITHHAVKKRYSEHEALICGRLVFFGLLLIFLITAMQQIGIQMTAILGAAGVVTVALSFAAKTAASNFVSGVFLIFERPFKIGDTIQIKNIQGTVEAIDLLSTKLKTSENTLTRIPNETINKSEITNLSHFKTRALNIKIPVSYTVDVNPIKTILLDLANKDKEVMEKPSPEVTLGDFTDSAINLNLTFWTHTRHANAVKNRLQEAIKQEFAKKEIKFP
jgi:small-conductance mechanosensitive channel